MVAITGTKKWIGLVLGIISIPFGIWILLSRFNVNLPFVDTVGNLSMTVLSWIVVLGSIFLVFDALWEMGAKRKKSFILAIVGVALGIIPILHSFFLIGFTLPEQVAVILFGIFLSVLGIFMIWDFTGG